MLTYIHVCTVNLQKSQDQRELSDLHEVDDREPVDNVSTSVCHSEVVPLHVTVSVEVTAQPQLILIPTTTTNSNKKNM